MTKYVLNSGGTSHNLEQRKLFHLEMIKSLGEAPKFLLCNFAQGREHWDTKFADYSQRVIDDMPAGVTPSFELAMPDTFVEQCKRAAVLYFHGGDDELLQYRMSKFDYRALFQNKVVVGVSAGSNMLSTHYWTCDWRMCADGFGILPIKFIPHYLANFNNGDPRGPIDWQKAYDELAVYGGTSLPIHALEEGHYIVIDA